MMAEYWDAKVVGKALKVAAVYDWNRINTQAGMSHVKFAFNVNQ